MNERSKQLRRDTIKLSHAHGGYHYGGCFSIIEILIALYDHHITETDVFILSKGHACWPWYVILREKGLNPKLEGHPSRDPYNGIICSTGSLGHGLPTAIGIALARKLKNEHGKVYVLMGDGECQEGTTWESLLIAAHHKLNNLIVIVDHNGIQGSGRVKDILPVTRMDEIADIIGWNSTSLIDGHNVEELREALSWSNESNHPNMITVSTIKGKGVSFMEDKPEWHAKYPDKEHVELAMMELVE